MNFIDRAALPAADAARIDAGSPGAASIGIRPDAVNRTPSGKPELAVTATIELIEPVGAESHVHLRWNNQMLIAQMRGAIGATDGEPITVHVDLDAIHRFDADGRRISAQQ